MKYSKTLRLSFDEVKKNSNYKHWIPIVQGYQHAYIEANYPGWRWEDFLPVLDHAGLLKRHNAEHQCGRLFQGLCLKPGITHVELTHQDSRTWVSSVVYERQVWDTKKIPHLSCKSKNLMSIFTCCNESCSSSVAFGLWRVIWRRLKQGLSAVLTPTELPATVELKDDEALQAQGEFFYAWRATSKWWPARLLLMQIDN